MTCYFWCSQLQEFRTGVTKQNMELLHAKEENKRLRTQMTDIRDKLNDLDARVCYQVPFSASQFVSVRFNEY